MDEFEKQVQTLESVHPLISNYRQAGKKNWSFILYETKKLTAKLLDDLKRLAPHYDHFYRGKCQVSWRWCSVSHNNPPFSLISNFTGTGFHRLFASIIISSVPVLREKKEKHAKIENSAFVTSHTVKFQKQRPRPALSPPLLHKTTATTLGLRCFWHFLPSKAAGPRRGGWTSPSNVEHVCW